MASSAGPSSDHTVNKIALCSAIFAGFAYVGYTVIKETVAKFRSSSKSKENGGKCVTLRQKRGRVYLRRLSGSDASTSTEVLLGSLESAPSSSSANPSDDKIRLVLRPLSVQERIRELNLRARHFAETVLAVQLQEANNSSTSDGSSSRPIRYTRSCQASPFGSPPRALSPIDITNLGSSRCNSIENLSMTESSPFRRRWTRRSPRNSGSFSQNEIDEEADAGVERLLEEREDELRRRLQGFADGTTKILTPYEAKSLVALLHSKDVELLEKTLITISNYAAFSTNQDYLREGGCLRRFKYLLAHPDRSVKTACIKAVGNMAVNVANQKEMGFVVPLLFPVIYDDDADDDELLLLTLTTLTNVAALDDWHKQFASAIPRLVELTNSSNFHIRIQVLRLLINLSTNEKMIPSLIDSKEAVWCILEGSQSDEQLLRVVTLLSNIIKNEHEMKSKKNPEEFSSVAVVENSLKSDNGTMDMRLNHLNLLMNTHPHEDIRQKSRIIFDAIFPQ